MRAFFVLAAVAASALVGFCPAAAHANVIFSNLSSDNGSNGAILGAQQVAGSFTTGSQGVTFKSVTVKVKPFYSNTDGNDLHVALCANVEGNVPALSPLIILDGPTRPQGYSTYTGALDLAADTTYWVKIYTDSSRFQFYFCSNAPDIGSGLGMKITYDSGAAWSVISSDPEYSLLMEVATVPEPITLGLLSVGGLALLKRRRANKA